MHALKDVMQGWIKNVWEEYSCKQFTRGAYKLANELLASGGTQELTTLEAIHESLNYSLQQRLQVFSYFKLLCFFSSHKYALAAHEAQLLLHFKDTEFSKNLRHLVVFFGALAKYRLYNQGREASLEAQELLANLQTSLDDLLLCFRHFSVSSEQESFFKECVGELFAEAQFLVARLYFILALLPVNIKIKTSLLLKSLSWLNAALANLQDENSNWVAFAYALRTRLRIDCYGLGASDKVQLDLAKSEKLFEKQNKSFPFGELKNYIYQEFLRERQKHKPAKNGYVYIMSYTKAPDFKHYKIGRSKRPLSRTKYLSTHSAFPNKLLHLIKCEDMAKAEAFFHAKFCKKRLNGEWFELDNNDLAYLKGFSKIGFIPKQLIRSVRKNAEDVNFEV
jgi:hypothetical protein